MRILYTGALRRGSLTESRRTALADLGHEVVALDQVPFIDRPTWISRKLHAHLLLGEGIRRYRRALVELARSSDPDLIYVDQAVYLSRDAVEDLRATGARVVHYTSDYFGYRSYVYRHLLRAIDLYDAHVITNQLNGPWLDRRGAKRIVFTEFAYDPVLHQPPQLTADERHRFASDVTFVGHWEPSYEAAVIALRAAGISVRVWGPGWRRARRMPDRREIVPALGDQYVKVLAGSKLCLGLLSKWNRNETTSRTFEIPAVGSFLLAERTPQHLGYFEDGREAAFFSSHEELVTKAKHYLADDDQRRAIARAGHERCLTSGYTHRDRIEAVLEALG